MALSGLNSLKMDGKSDDPRREDLDQYLPQLELVGKTDVATSLGLPSAMLWVQSCACFAAYYNYHHGIVPFPEEEHPEIDVQLPCMPLLKYDEVPSYLYPTTPYPFLRRAILVVNSKEKVGGTGRVTGMRRFAIYAVDMGTGFNPVSV
ncbi:GLUCOSYL/GLUCURONOSYL TRANSFERASES [Salix viminalis]|uniref:GLUCOSYL/GLUCURONOSYL TRANSFERASES n=1 Tax=Salix viminalis TaxID=40686 RepID=A0A9Q0NJV2_SALVM|nr:GLUCOSYL/GLUCURONOSYL TRANSFERASES [Salix viminalis]